MTGRDGEPTSAGTDYQSLRSICLTLCDRFRPIVLKKEVLHESGLGFDVPNDQIASDFFCAEDSATQFRPMRVTSALSASSARHAPQVLRSCCKQELILRPVQPSQSQAIEPEDMFEVCEQHLNLLPLAPTLHMRACLRDCARHCTRIDCALPPKQGHQRCHEL
jgi:hypothetical protein